MMTPPPEQMEPNRLRCSHFWGNIVPWIRSIAQ
jgi:hypothetical protein